MCSNNVEYSTASGTYCTTHDFKVPFCMSYVSSIKITSLRFHIDNNERESGIGYGIIVDRDLMVQIGLPSDFKCQVLQWYGVTVTAK